MIRLLNPPMPAGHLRRRSPPAALLVVPLLAAALTAALTTAGLAAQEPSAAPPTDDVLIESVDVPRVLVDLVVETRSGEPVLDLERHEVRVFEDDRPVEILGWSPPRAARSWQESEDRDPSLRPETTAGEPTTFVLFLDELHLRPTHKAKFLKQARQVAEELVASGSQVLLAAWDGSLRIVQPPTREYEPLRRALDAEIKEGRMPMQALMADPAQAMSLIQDRMRDNTEDRGERNTVVDRPSSQDPCVDVGGLARTHAEQAASAAESSIRGLVQMIASLARFDGRKSLLLVSEGIPLVPGLDVYTYAMEMCDGTAARQGLPNAVDTQEFGAGKNTRWDPRTARTDAYNFDTTHLWRQLTSYANAQQVSVYPIQASGLQGLHSAGAQDLRTTGGLQQVAAANLRDTFTLAARQTGGRTFFDGNDLGQAILAAAEDADSVYELSFAPTHPGDGRTHDIRVEVDRPGVIVRHRQSYRALPASELLEGRVFAALIHGEGANPLDVRVVPAVPEAAERGETTVMVQIFVPLSRLAMVPAGSDQKGRFTVAVGGRQANGRFLEIGSKQIDVLASEVDAASQAFLYEVEIPFRSEGLELSVAVRDDLGGTVSTLRRSVATTS